MERCAVRLPKRTTIYELISCAGVLVMAAGLMIMPEESVEAAKNGLKLCANVIIPSLFPFFVLSGMLVELDAARWLGLLFERFMRPLFNLGGSCAVPLMLGFLGGYPTGARTAIAIYEKGLCSKAEAERLLAFCNNSGPAFILGVVGAGIFSSGRAGIILYLSHTLASILIGIGFRFYKRNSPVVEAHADFSSNSEGFVKAFLAAVRSALSAVLNICSFVVFFTVVIGMLYSIGVIPWLAKLLSVPLGPVGLGADEIEQLLAGLIEVSSGVWSIRDAAGSIQQQLAMAAFMLGWAGLSVHCQVLSFVGESGLSSRTYIAGKFIHGLVSAVIVYFASLLFIDKLPVSAYLIEQLGGLYELDMMKALLLSLTASAAILLVVSLCAVLLPPVIKKDGKNQGNLL